MKVDLAGRFSVPICGVDLQANSRFHTSPPNEAFIILTAVKGIIDLSILYKFTFTVYNINYPDSSNQLDVVQPWQNRNTFMVIEVTGI